MHSCNLLFKYAAFVVLLAIAVISCKKDETTTGPPPSTSTTISGTVRTFGGQPIADAVVLVYSGNTITGTPLDTATSNTSGHWQVVLTAAGKYTRIITAASFPTSLVTLNVSAGQTLNDTATLASQTINGIVNDAQTGQPVANATVRFFSGSSNDTSGYRFNDVTTSGQGAWTNTFTLGSYVYAIYASNRVPLVSNLAITDTSIRQLTTTITAPVAAGQMRIVLNWGAQPDDLDSHLTGDTTNTAGQGRYHVYYGDRVAQLANGDTVAFLDHDDVTSFGPETITIFRFFSGNLRYKIHDYSNRSGTGSHYMSDSSGATVRVYTSAGLIREDHIRTGVAGNQWYVYNINGANQQISFVNTISDGISSPSDTSFRPTVLPPKKRVND